MMSNNKIIEHHYETALAQVYSWMYGGFEENRLKYQKFFVDRNIQPTKPFDKSLALDLGAGSGFQSIPLADLGFVVHAYDLSSTLLTELMERSQRDKRRIVNTFQEDILNFPTHLQRSDKRLELVICMTDTLTHLPTHNSVQELISKVYNALDDDGKFIVSFRDLKTRELHDMDRCIPVRNDENTIFTCFLEYHDDKVLVHDIIYKRNFTTKEWDLVKSCYWKLRLAPKDVLDVFVETGFDVDEFTTENGFVTIIGRKPSQVVQD